MQCGWYKAVWGVFYEKHLTKLKSPFVNSEGAFTLNIVLNTLRNQSKHRLGNRLRALGFAHGVVMQHRSTTFHQFF